MNNFNLVLVLAVTALTSAWVGADAGHDHDPAPTVANTNAPQRLPDGSVYLAQTHAAPAGIANLVAKQGRSPQTFELFGKVTMDPNAGGKVQPTVAGRIEPGPRGLPSLGQSVRKGEMLALVRPSVGAIRTRESGGAGR